MLHKEIFGLCLLGFILYCFFAMDPSERISRVCSPVRWTGNLITTGTSMLTPRYQTDMQKWWAKFDYSCQFGVWRLFYQDDYNKALAAQQAQQQATGTTPATQPAPAQPIKR